MYVRACTRLHPPPITVMTLTFLFVMCVGNVYLQEGWGPITCCWLPPPPPVCPSANSPLRSHTHTCTQWRLERGNRGVSLLRRLSAPCSHQHSNHNTIHLLTASVVPCDWDTSGSGRKGGGGGGIGVVWMQTRGLSSHREKHITKHYQDSNQKPVSRL